MRGLLCLFLFALLQVPAGAQLDINAVRTQRVATGFSNPVGISNAGDGSGRLFVVEQSGRIWILDSDLNRLGQPFLDIRNRVIAGGERGLLSVAFPPDFATSQVFFVNYTNPATVVARFQVSAGNPNQADPNSEIVYLTEPQPFSNHNGGDMHFGPDGYLYVGMGDGGSGNDPGNRAQDLSTRLGKMLRLDVSQGAPARAPTTNPFFGQSNVRPEIWSYGLRNPWRFSFDRATGDLVIGDVGQQQREEVTFEPAGVGGLNHGWRRMEGTRCNIPSVNCNDGSLILPILEYDHTGGRCSITGGYVYRGVRFPALAGSYFFGDFCTGELFGAQFVNGSWSIAGTVPMGFSISAFGEDEAGEVYFTNYSGEIYRIEAAVTAPTISGGGIVNAASLTAGAVSPGSIVSVFGTGLAGQTATATQLPLPTTLGGSAFTFGGAAAEMFFASPGQANILVPRSLEGTASAQLVPTRDGVSGPAATVSLTPFAPGVFTMDQSGSGQGAVLVAGTGMLAAPAAQFQAARAARAGDGLEIYATGLGPVAAVSGLRPQQGIELFQTTQQPTATLGGVDVPVLFSGLAPGFEGVYQVNAEVTGQVPVGPAVPLVIRQGGVASNTVTVAIE